MLRSLCVLGDDAAAAAIVRAPIVNTRGNTVGERRPSAILSDIAINDPAGFKALVDKAAKAASSPVAKADQDKAKKAA